MKTPYRRTRTLLVLAMLLSLFEFPAAANPSLLVDADTGSVLFADEATTPWHPASTAKLMTVYLALKAVKEHRLMLETPLAGTRRAASQRPSKIGIKPGQIITLDNALKILLVKSANDLAYVIGEAIGGNAENFVAMMNSEAGRLGMRESVFTNPNGWHDPRQQVSARDLAILALALLRDFPEYQEYWGIGSVDLGGHVYKNTNGLIGRYPGAMGMKTGFVCASGFNVVALANRNGRTLIAVVLGASSGAERTIMAAQLLDRGFASGQGNTTLDQLPASDRQTASSIRDEVCGRHRKAPLTEEDSDGVVASAPSSQSTGDGTSVYATIHENYLMRAGGPIPSTRYTLAERSLGMPVMVYLGRAPGNTDAVYNASGLAVAEKTPRLKDIASDASEPKPATKGASRRTQLARAPILGTPSVKAVARKQSPVKSAAARISPSPSVKSAKLKTGALTPASPKAPAKKATVTQ